MQQTHRFSAIVVTSVDSRSEAEPLPYRSRTPQQFAQLAALTWRLHNFLIFGIATALNEQVED